MRCRASVLRDEPEDGSSIYSLGHAADQSALPSRRSFLLPLADGRARELFACGRFEGPRLTPAAFREAGAEFCIARLTTKEDIPPYRLGESPVNILAAL